MLDHGGGKQGSFLLFDIGRFLVHSSILIVPFNHLKSNMGSNPVQETMKASHEAAKALSR